MALDKIMGKLGGRKFLAWVGSCALLVSGNIDESTWLYITAFFMGGTALVDSIASLKGTKPPSADVKRALAVANDPADEKADEEDASDS